jgi:RNA 3'-terminal phosphate cyclase (GTP)
MTYLEIDGNMGEGGGSILRLGVSLSNFFHTPVKISNIRANRPNPGLRPQHLAGLLALTELTGATISNAEIGTTAIEFKPGNSLKTSLNVSIKTAGSISLLAQTLQVACLKYKNSEPVKITVDGGGTFGLGAPDPYFLNNVTFQLFEKMGYKCKLNILNDGFYPKGGAKAKMAFFPLQNPEKELKPLLLTDQGGIQKISGIIVVSSDLEKASVAERIKKTVLEELTAEIPVELINLKMKYIKSLSSGVGLSIWAKFRTGAIVSSGTILGKRGISSETVGKTAARNLIKQIKSGATIDSFVGDQLIPLLFICNKKSAFLTSEITRHMKTNISLMEKFVNRNWKIGKMKESWKFEISEVT